MMQISPGHVLLAVFTLTDITDLAHYAALISLEEKQRAARFKHPQHQDRYTAFHGMMRETLARYVPNETAATLQFHHTENGKPYLPHHPDIQFNLSHTDDVAVLAITHQACIGVDIETQKPLDFDALAKRFFSADEYALLSLYPDDTPEKTRAFYQLWTGKEAYLKALGLGIADHLKEFSLALEPLRIATTRLSAMTPWTLQTQDYLSNYIITFATMQEVRFVEMS